MLNPSGFDLWADGYDRSVGLSDAAGRYPFAGYREVLQEIYRAVLTAPGRTVLDVGIGTGTLSTQLSRQGCRIFGQDFSPQMLRIAQQKLPQAALYAGDFTQGLVPELTARRYDAIVATYSLHHLTRAQKLRFLPELQRLLNPGGCVYIGDVAFPTRAALEACRRAAGDDWDAAEHYFVYDELPLPGLTFRPFGPCAALLTLPPL